MNNLSEILEEQLKKLPSRVVDFLASSNWQEVLTNIGISSRLSPQIVDALENEVVLVLAGLVHPDAFHGELVSQTKIDEVTLSGVVAEIEEKIFEPVRPELVKFYEDQTALENSNEQEGVEEPKQEEPIEVTTQKEVVPTIPSRVWEKVPEVVPHNLPIEEEVPPAETPQIFERDIIPQTMKPGMNAQTSSPFEEKMKKVFTGRPTPMNDLELEAPQTTSTEPASPQVAEYPADPMSRARHDPYREPIE
ncbi:MAG: hypothetical protein PHS95_00770 [Candidatus Pacebacteria bacterium]|nr:hypothetical protein [Candidatus Paceibacterota bacterium]